MVCFCLFLSRTSGRLVKASRARTLWNSFQACILLFEVFFFEEVAVWSNGFKDAQRENSHVSLCARGRGDSHNLVVLVRLATTFVSLYVSKKSLFCG